MLVISEVVVYIVLLDNGLVLVGALIDKVLVLMVALLDNAALVGNNDVVLNKEKVLV